MKQLDRGPADRLVAIFTGYKGPKSILLRAARRARLDVDKAHLWSKYDVHRLVAHYLCLRFPVCLALNKVDLFRDGEEGLASIQQCMREARRRGEVAVPVSAACESFRLSVEAAEQQRRNNITQQQFNEVPLSSSTSSPAARSADCGWDTFNKVVAKFGSTGVMTAISSAVALRPPVLCYVVADLDTEAPVVWSHAAAAAALSGDARAVGDDTTTRMQSSIPRLRDCILLKPGSTVGDVFTALSRGAIPSVVVQGEFVRAEGRSLNRSSRRRQVGRDTVVTEDICVLRIQTNRKSVFKSNTGASTAAIH
jgi:hypothetical protein